MSEKSLFQNIPSVNALLDLLTEKYPTVKNLYLKRLVLKEIEQVRTQPDQYNLADQSRETLTNKLLLAISNHIDKMMQGTLRKVINASGVVLHTGLGRAPVNPELMKKVIEVSRYANLEINLNDGRRGERTDHIDELLQLLTGAEAGLAVNNNAAAVMLMLNSVGYQKEIILSRGEMVEIGGSFRLPEVMRMSGCILHEVGTTNKTHLRDYKKAINQNTGGILVCHTSNYEIQGFTQKPDLEELTELARAKNIPLLYDLGSGSLLDTKQFGSDSEPVIGEIVEQGVDLISFSGDKLLGGPQAGIIIGSKFWVDKCGMNHMLRALRLDKFMLKALQETLLQYLEEDNLSSKLDGIRALTADASGLKERCTLFIQKLPSKLSADFSLNETTGKVGSGAYPTMKLASFAIRIKPLEISTNQLAIKLRTWSTPIFSYITDNALFLDLRTVASTEEDIIISALKEYLQ